MGITFQQLPLRPLGPVFLRVDMLVRFEVDCAWGANKSALQLPSGGSLGKI